MYGLLKMREQEHDLERGIQADGDTPGVTISFIAFDTGILKSCLENPTAENRKKMGMEINRVVAYPKQNHHPALKEYFIRPQAEAPYLVADTYVKHIARYARILVLRKIATQNAWLFLFGGSCVRRTLRVCEVILHFAF